MANISELVKEQAKGSAPKEAEVDEAGPEDVPVIQDILEAATLLAQARTLLEYLGDVQLCKRITKKERGVMLDHAYRVKEFLDGVEGVYEEGF